MIVDAFSSDAEHLEGAAAVGHAACGREGFSEMARAGPDTKTNNHPEAC